MYLASIWARAKVVKGKSAQEDILKQIKKLNDMREKRPIIIALFRYQKRQLTVLLDELAVKEKDLFSEWSLVQLDCVKKLLYLKCTLVQVDAVAKLANSKPSRGKQLFGTI